MAYRSVVEPPEPMMLSQKRQHVRMIESAKKHETRLRGTQSAIAGLRNQS